MDKKTISVAIAIIKKPLASTNMQYLVAWRDKTKHQGDCYEFIGGKVDGNETAFEALQRECKEEIGIQVTHASFLKTIAHEYPDINITLHVFLIEDFLGRPFGAEGQNLVWKNQTDLLALPMPKANDVIKKMAVLQTKYCISKTINQFSNQDKWLSFYQKNLQKNSQFYIKDEILSAIDYVNLVKKLHVLRPDLGILVHWQHQNLFTEENSLLIIGFHMTDSELSSHPSHEIVVSQQLHVVIASCHDEKSLKKAKNIAVDAVAILPIQQKNIEYESQLVDWDSITTIIRNLNMPVYALDRMTVKNIKPSQKNDCGEITEISMMHT